MVTISTQHLQDVFTSLGLEIRDNNNDKQISSQTNGDTISYNVQTAPNEWRTEEYTLTETDLSSYEQFTAVIQRISGNNEISILGNGSSAYAVFKRPAGIYEKKYFPWAFVDYVNLETGSSLTDVVDPSTSYGYRSIRFVGSFPRFSLFDEVSTASYQAEILKFRKQDEDAICSGQTSNAFETKCREDISNLTENFETSLTQFASGFAELQKDYASFSARFEHGALQFTDVEALETAFAQFESIDQAYQSELKKTASILRSKKIDAERFRSAQVKTPK